MKYRIITIEREYASGGSEIGARVGLELDVPCYGKEVLERAAERMQTVPERLIHLEESTSKQPAVFAWHGKTAWHLVSAMAWTEAGELYVVEEQVIQDMALQGPCVIVGRCAGWILREARRCAACLYPCGP